MTEIADPWTTEGFEEVAESTTREYLVYVTLESGATLSPKTVTASSAWEASHTMREKYPKATEIKAKSLEPWFTKSRGRTRRGRITWDRTPRICHFCGEEFTPNANNQIFCQRICTRTYHSDKIKAETAKRRAEDRSAPIQCKGCGVSFIRTSGIQVYCNRVCQTGASNRRKLERKKELNNPKEKK